MSSDLSCLAKHFIADFLNGVDTYFASNEWRLMTDIYHLAHRPRMPPAQYTMTTEFALCLKKIAWANDVRYLLTPGPDAWFWFIVPQGLLSRIVEVGVKTFSCGHHCAKSRILSFYVVTTLKVTKCYYTLFPRSSANIQP